MARLIFISPYLKGGENKTKLAHRTNYIATREGVELLKSERGSEPATKKQQEYISRLTKSFPQSKELGEYEDYLSAPTKDSAAEFIDQVWEQFVTAMDERENFLDYVSHRPGVRSDGEHGLWDKDGKVPNLKRAVEEVANHSGIVWTPVVSLRRGDAERLGYTDVDNWRALVNSCAQEIAKGYKIPLEHLQWYAALHEKEKHVHIHMVVFSIDPKEGYLTKDGIRNIKSAFATHIFEQDLVLTYARKTEYRNRLQESAEKRMTELISDMNRGADVSERLEQLVGELAERLRTTKGKKVYGYLSPRVKRIVDEIVDELTKDGRVAAAYSLWQDMRDEVVRTYTDELPERMPLSHQKEFKPVRNMVIREALRLAERKVTFDDENMEDKPEQEETDEAPHANELDDRYRRAKKLLYDEDAAPDEKQRAIETLKELWEEGYAPAAYQLGKVYLKGEYVEKDVDTAIRYLKGAAEQGNQYAQYILGKIYLLGQEVTPDREAAVDYLARSAAQGNRYAQFFLEHMNTMRSPSIELTVLRMFHHMANVFRDSTSDDTIHKGIHIDRKRRRALQEKRIALGHKPDDHEEQTMG